MRFFMKVIKTAIILVATTALLMIPTERICSDQNIPDRGTIPFKLYDIDSDSLIIPDEFSKQ